MTAVFLYLFHPHKPIVSIQRSSKSSGSCYGSRLVVRSSVWVILQGVRSGGYAPRSALEKLFFLFYVQTLSTFKWVTMNISTMIWYLYPETCLFRYVFYPFTPHTFPLRPHLDILHPVDNFAPSCG